MNEPQSEPSEVEKLLGFRVKDGMVWIEGKMFKGFVVPRIDHMQKAVEVIQGLLDRQKFERENP